MRPGLTKILALQYHSDNYECYISGSYKGITQFSIFGRNAPKNNRFEVSDQGVFLVETVNTGRGRVTETYKVADWQARNNNNECNVS